MNAIGNFLGEICKTLIPIPEEVFFGNENSSISICTLSSMDLLKEISNSTLMNEISVVGRLLSENKGIDSLIKHIVLNPKIKTIILCGKEVIGHQAGHSLIQLHKHGVNHDGRIKKSNSPEPFLLTRKTNISKFQNQVEIINKIGETDFLKIRRLVNSLENQ